MPTHSDGTASWTLSELLKFSRTLDTTAQRSFAALVKDAGNLLEYAALSGIDIEPDVQARFSAAARWTTAAIAVAVIGLFTSSTANGDSLPPLALAFLVGYGVEAFFNFIDRLLQTTGQLDSVPQSQGKTPARNLCNLQRISCSWVGKIRKVRIISREFGELDGSFNVFREATVFSRVIAGPRHIV